MDILPSEYIGALREALDQLDLDAIHHASACLDQARQAGRTIFVIGNGGSAATASHFAADLNKLASLENIPYFKAMCLTDNISLVTAWANDGDFEHSLNHFLNFACPGDVLVILSTSGQSLNLLMVGEEARARQLGIIAIVGTPHSRAAKLADVSILTPAPRQTQQEDVASAVCHMLAEMLR